MSTNYLQMIQKVDKLPIYTDIDTLDIYCEYLLNDGNRAINFANLTNLRELIESMDPKLMMSSDSKMARYEFIRLYLEGRIEKGIVRKKLCLSYVDDNVEPRYRKTIRREIINSIDEDMLSKKDIAFINDMVYAQLNVSFMQRYKVGMMRMIEDLNNGDFGKTSEDCDNAIQFVQSMLSDLTKAQRRSKQDNRFNLTDENHFKAVMAEACERLLSDTQYWRTGMQGLNSMLNGGLENARCYNFIGATGGFKSGLLLNLMKGVKLYNKGHLHKDPSKRPTILFISQENNIWETIARIFSIFGDGTSIRNYKPDQIMEILKEGGFGVVDDDLDIDIEFRYYGNMELSVPDIKGIVDELDSTGREVVVIIQDYVERLRPPIPSADRRIQLSDVSNQIHDIAIELDIPFVTASQFNRSGAETVEVMRAADKVDIGKHVGMKDISESYGMLKNFDANIGIIIEYDQKEERFYLSFRALKYRGDDSQALTYFLQPFVGKNSKIQLQDDVLLDVPVYRTTLADGMFGKVLDETEELGKMTRSHQKGIMIPDTALQMETFQEFNQALHDDHKRATDNIQNTATFDILMKDSMGRNRLSCNWTNVYAPIPDKKATLRKMFEHTATKVMYKYAKSVETVNDMYMSAPEESTDNFSMEEAIQHRKKGVI